MSSPTLRLTWLAGIAFSALVGCSSSNPLYLRDDKDLSHYKSAATNIEYPDVQTTPIEDVARAQPPLTLANSEAREVWDLKLQDAVQTAVFNAKTLRSLGAQAFVPNSFAGGSRFGDPTRLVGTPESVVSTYGPSIVETDPRFGTEAALSAFDAQLSTNLFFNGNNRPQNLAITTFQQQVFRQDLIQNTTQLQKITSAGGVVSARNHNNYELNNNTANAFPSVWSPDVEVEFRQPILQGAGVQFNRIAGPNGGNQGTPGQYTGVAIARINHDIALADVEVGVRNLLNEVESTYWRLYYNYRDLDARVVGRDSALITWRKIHALFQEGARGGEAEKEAQAREQYFLFRSQVETALSDLYSTENNLRYIMGIAATDGRLIRPADEPTTARVQFDWQEAHAEALSRSAELRKQRWRLKQRELQLIAAKNFLMPRLDFDALYRVRGFGNNLFSPNQQVTTNPQSAFATPQNLPFGSAYGTLLDGSYTDYQYGFSFQMPLGFRQAMAGVRNEELNLARERAVLQDQELELSHQLSNAIRNLDRFYMLSQTIFNRRVAAERQVEAVKAAYNTGTVTLDLLLQAQRVLADAESAYYDALALYNLSISQVHLRKGSLLEYNGVYLAEGPWAGKAYFDARKRAKERDAGFFIDYGFTRPNVFSRGPIDQQTGVNRGTPSNERPQSPTQPPRIGGPQAGIDPSRPWVRTVAPGFETTAAPLGNRPPTDYATQVSWPGGEASRATAGLNVEPLPPVSIYAPRATPNRPVAANASSP